MANMKNNKKSLYLTLGIIIITTVTIIMSIHSAYSYISIKDKIIEDMKINSRATIISLKDNVSNLLASYSVNEYENLIFNEIKRRNIFAIVVEDYNMGKILGKKSYITGKIRDEALNIIEYDSQKSSQKDQLEKCFYSDSFDITTPLGKKIGKLSIYISDDVMNKELNKIIKVTLIDTMAISLLLFLLLFIMIRFFVLKPISDIVEAISDCDKDGVPLIAIPNAGAKEINLLSNTMNHMIDSIKASRQVLKENKNRLEYLLELSPISVRIAKNKGKKVVFANKAYSKLLQITDSTAINKNPKDYYAHKSVYKKIVESLKKNDCIYNKLIELNVHNKVVWALASYMNIDFDGEKSTIGWFYDVTKEKENEVKLFQALELQTTIFDNSGYLIIRTDKNGIIKQTNKETERLLGYTSKDLVDRYTPDILHLESEIKLRAEEFSKELNQQIKPGFDVFIIKSTLGLDNEYEWTYKTKDGILVPVLLSISALKNKENKIYGYLGIAKDITEQKLMESQSRLAAMGEMIGNIAHQWRQPLSVISTISSGIKVKNEFDMLDISAISEDMDQITKQTQYLSRTIDDFRDFIKGNNKKERIDVSNTVQKAMSLLHSSMVVSDINIILDLKDDISINGFENQLIQAIINIINNSKDALNEQIKEGDKLIFIGVQKVSENLILTIKDNAGGIPEDLMHRIFEPYFTTKHKSIGTGIGLSMVYQIITKHHGSTIDVSNESYQYNGKEYRGACFMITFKDIY